MRNPKLEIRRHERISGVVNVYAFGVNRRKRRRFRRTWNSLVSGNPKLEENDHVYFHTS
jgi:hypothetical protein